MKAIRTPEDAEEAAAEWMREWGFEGRDSDSAGADEGIDVNCTGAIAQVEAQAAPVGRPVVQQTFGIAAADSKVALVFSLGGFTDEAVEWASTAGVALLTFNYNSEIIPVNTEAESLMRDAAPSVHPSDRYRAETGFIVEFTTEMATNPPNEERIDRELDMAFSSWSDLLQFLNGPAVQDFLWSAPEQGRKVHVRRDRFLQEIDTSGPTYQFVLDINRCQESVSPVIGEHFVLWRRADSPWPPPVFIEPVSWFKGAETIEAAVADVEHALAIAGWGFTDDVPVEVSFIASRYSDPAAPEAQADDWDSIN